MKRVSSENVRANASALRKKLRHATMDQSHTLTADLYCMDYSAHQFILKTFTRALLYSCPASSAAGQTRATSANKSAGAGYGLEEPTKQKSKTTLVTKKNCDTGGQAGEALR
jgi:hypothetical protein